MNTTPSFIKVIGIRKHPDCDFVLDVCYNGFKFEVRARKIVESISMWFQYSCLDVPAFELDNPRIDWQRVWNECEKARKNIVEALSL